MCLLVEGGKWRARGRAGHKTVRFFPIPRARGQRWETRACHVFAVLLLFDRLSVVHNCSVQQPRTGQPIMENCPPHNLARRPSLMHSRHPSKSSPAKRDAASRILTPQYSHNAVPPPTTDAFNTGLLTPQASQNTFDSDAATSLISPPPEDSARAGINRPSVRVMRYLSLFSLTDHRSWNQPSLTRADSEPASDLRHVANTGSSSKRKRPTFVTSLSLPDSGGPSQQPQRMAEASPNPKPRKQTRRARVGSGVGELIFFFFFGLY